MLPLYLTENISGVKVALGAANEAEIASAYASNIVRLISDVLKGNDNTKVLDVSLTPMEKPPEDTVESPSITEPVEIFEEINVEDILAEIENYCFNIEAELGEVLNVVVNSPLISNSLSQSVDNSYKDVETVVREDLDCNFMIRYRDVYKNIKEMKEVN